MRIAIECKNEVCKVEAPVIDAFVGKLTYVGLPVQHGIVVSSHGFTIGARERAADAGIKLFGVNGLTGDHLTSAVYEAYQSIVFLFLRVHSVSSLDPQEGTWTMQPSFINAQGTLLGTIFEPIWTSWLNGKLPTIVGPCTADVVVPQGWGQIIDGQFVPFKRLRATLQINALVVTHQGQYSHHELINATNEEVEKWHVEARFDVPVCPFPFAKSNPRRSFRSTSSSLLGFSSYLAGSFCPASTYSRYSATCSGRRASRVSRNWNRQRRHGLPQATWTRISFGGQPIDVRTFDSIFDPISSVFQITLREEHDSEQEQANGDNSGGE